MFEKIFKGLFSMKAMAISMIIFAVAIGYATFIESDYGTPASKIAVYNARWFEVLLLHLSITLIVNIADYRMYQKHKIPTLIFHLSFLLMIVGAALTRYIGFEGQMRIGVGETTNIIYSSTPYFSIKAHDGVSQYDLDMPHWLSEGVKNPFTLKFQLPNQEKVKVEYVSYMEEMVDTLLKDEKDGKDAVELFIRGESKYLFEGQQSVLGGLNLSFQKDEPSFPGVEIKSIDGSLYIQSIEELQIVDMMRLTPEDRMKNHIPEEAISIMPADTLVPLYLNFLYEIGNESVVFKSYQKKVRLTKVKGPDNKGDSNVLTIKITSGNETTFIEIDGSPSHIIQKEYFHFAGLDYEVGYGATPIEIPFYVKCNEFILSKYPGSEMPSSYESKVTYLDQKRGKELDAHIYMNNFYDYGGYRFFQSSYYPDGSGTVLSVNFDRPGTIVTYIAYFLMGLGMLWNVFTPKGRISELNNLIRKSRENRMKMIKSFTVILGLTFGGQFYAQETDAVDLNNETNVETVIEEDFHDHDSHDGHNHPIQKMDAKFLSLEDAVVFDDMLVQDYDGRTIPYHTLCDKLLRKVHHSDVYVENGVTYNAVQTLTAMHLYGSDAWYDVPLIFVSSKIRDQIGLNKYASLDQMEDETGMFKWMAEYQEAYEKSDAQKNEFDKQLIKLGERYTIVREILRFGYFRVVPIPDDAAGKWVWPFALELEGHDQTGNVYAFNILNGLFQYMESDGEFSVVTDNLEKLKEHQWTELRKFEATQPLLHKLTKRHVNVEIAYNKFKIFDKIQSSYFMFGFLLLIIFFIRTLLTPTIKREKLMKRIALPIIVLLILVFVAHGVGLGMRWYISGHAPWSDGYEAIIFVSWITVLVGFIFGKKNPAVIAVAVFLSAMMLFVTELNLMDPEITPLEPVLQSYWLMIHVATITASYGFLAVSAMLGMLNMLLYLLMRKSNKKRLQMNVIELTSVSEISMIVGLFLLSAGTFLGGVWANESWGRYWGWDPKEVWALVSMLVYATIIHLRWIPALSSRFLFNVLSLWGYAAILFTFFGVNFILVGLHSYAQGDGVAEWPTGVIVAIVLFSVFTIGTTAKYLMDNKKSKLKSSGETEE